ncbi:advillin-like isoform X2 [Zophobas morio]|uniref:advillin-like isoform X2 n=1 Tax=Zophobas morio TaxID=2755281 RepID=UPI003083EB7C
MDILDKGENLFDSENKQKLSKFGLSPEVITGKKILGAIKKGTHELKSTKDQFKHEPILLKLKGKKKIRVSEVEINIQSLNHYDVFILDDGKGTLFLFKGRNARRLIHGYAVNLCQKMKDQDYAGRGKVVNVEDDGINSTIKSEQSFWEALKGDKSNIPDVDDDADEIYERNYMESRDFYEKESDNEFHSKKLASPSRKMLNNSKCYIIKCGEALYIWNGANADIETRKECADFATQLQSKITSRSWAPVRTIIDKGEPTYFREFFSDWSDQSTFSAKPAFGQKNLGVSTVEKKSITEIDVNEMLKEDTKLITALDDGTGSLKVWHCTEKVITEIKEIEFGQFFAEESYLVLYKRSDKAEEFILYIWRGAKGRPNDLGAAGVQACSINQEYGAKHINIEQNKENEHFLKIFEKRNGFCVEEGSRYLDKKIDRLYKVLENSNGCRACYIIKKFSSLSSNATFIAVSKDKTWIWKGDGSSNTVIGYAHKVAKLVSHVPPIELHEGNESKEFIDFFGSKESYGNDLFLKEPGMSKYLRMWHISQHVGEPKTQELEQPTQKDFESQAVYIIDCFYAIFVWVGSNASQYGYQLAIKTAHNLEQHVKKKEVARNKFNMRATIVYSGEEPLSFKALFITWNDEKTKKIKKGANENIYRKTASAYVAEALQELQGGKKYAAEELGVDLAKLPPGVDPAKREDSLQDDEFEKAFKMSKEKYYALPQWKQLQIKRSSNLF